MVEKPAKKPVAKHPVEWAVKASLFDRDTLASVLADRLDRGIEVSGVLFGVPWSFTVKTKPEAK